MTQRVLVVDLAARAPVWSLPDWGAALIRQSADDWEVRIVAAPTSNEGDGGTAPSTEVIAAIGDAEVYFGFGMSPPLLAAAPALRWIHSAAAGVGSTLFPEMLARELALTNSAGVHAVPIAEYVVGGVLHFLRGFDIAIEQQRRSAWEKERFVGAESPVREIGDCRALILGTGGIGREVALRLNGLGARCTGVRRRPERGAPPGFERVITLAELDAELPSIDLLIIAAPLTEETRRAIGAPQLALLSRQAIVVNVARGALLDEEALADALLAGRLRGAVLDVFAREPLPATSRLWTAPGVLLTPHVSPVSPAAFWRRELELFLQNWDRYRRDEPLKNLVDKQAGY